MAIRLRQKKGFIPTPEFRQNNIGALHGRNLVTGYTLLELMVVIGILATMMTLAIVSLVQAQNRMALESTKSDVVRQLESARSRAMNGYGTDSQGLHIKADRVVSFEVNNPNFGYETFFSRGVSASPVDIIFTRFSGITTATEVVTLMGKDADATIDVNQNGAIIPQ